MPAESSNDKQPYNIRQVDLPESQKTAQSTTGNLYSNNKEFKAFWGDEISTHWFGAGSFIYLPYVGVIALAIFILYLCSILLFSFTEFFHLFQMESANVVVEQEQIDSILEYYRSAESTLKNSE